MSRPAVHCVGGGQRDGAGESTVPVGPDWHALGSTVGEAHQTEERPETEHGSTETKTGIFYIKYIRIELDYLRIGIKYNSCLVAIIINFPNVHVIGVCKK